MIAKKYRISRNIIDYILKKGGETDSKLFIIRYVANNKGFNRYRSIVSKKIYPKAVDRNRLRRQIYESVRLSEKETTKKDNFTDIILIPKKGIIKVPYEDIEKDVRQIIKIYGRPK
ncbi:MAG: ribonuclease P protein component [Candidatus Peregrinibacteria bacterium]